MSSNIHEAQVPSTDTDSILHGYKQFLNSSYDKSYIWQQNFIEISFLEDIKELM